MPYKNYLYHDRPTGNFHAIANGSPTPDLRRDDDTISCVPPGSETLMGDLVMWLGGTTTNAITNDFVVDDEGHSTNGSQPKIGINGATAQYLQVNSAFGYPPITIATILKVTSGSSGAIVQNTGNADVRLRLISSTTMGFAWNGSEYTNIPYASNTTLHLALVIDKGNTDIYINGALNNHFAYSATDAPQFTGTFTIGGTPTNAIAVGNFGVWRRALNKVEVAALYNGGSYYDPTV